MRRFLVAASLAAMAFSAPVWAATSEFATFGAYADNTPNINFKQDDSPGAFGGHLYTSLTADNVAAGVLTNLNFNLLGVPTDTYRTLFKLDANTNKAASQTNVPGVGLFDVQSGFHGSFEFRYEGHDNGNPVDPITIGSTTYNVGDLLFAGTFENAVISGRDKSGTGGLDDTADGSPEFAITNITWTTLPTTGFAATDPKAIVIALGQLGSGFPTLIDSNKQLKSFSVTAGGHFHDTSVPEASTWAMMLIGFGAMGTSVRARRRTDRKQPAFA